MPASVKKHNKKLTPRKKLDKVGWRCRHRRVIWIYISFKMLNKTTLQYKVAGREFISKNRMIEFEKFEIGKFCDVFASILAAIMFQFNLHDYRIHDFLIHTLIKNRRTRNAHLRNEDKHKGRNDNIFVFPEKHPRFLIRF